MDLTYGEYKIAIGGEWYLEDLHVFTKTYEQVYFLIYSLLPHDDMHIRKKIQYAYSQFPWHGGYSAVNFYNKLKYTTPPKERPQIISMRYASPGFIELGLIVKVAISVGIIVKTLYYVIGEGNKIYNEIYKGMQERKLLRIKREEEELRLLREHEDFINKSANKMADILQLKELRLIHNNTGSPLKTLKILLSLYRRARLLAEFKEKKKLE